MEPAKAKTNTLSVPKRQANIVNSLFKDTNFTDVALYGTTVSPSGQHCRENLQVFRAHKVVLAAGSEFFNALFSSTEFADSNKAEYKLEKVSHEILKPILEVLYTGEVTDSRIFDDVEFACDMLASLKYLLMDDVALACENILIEHHLNVKNCTFVWKFACKHSNLPKLMTEVEKLIAKSLSELKLEESFLRLKAEELCQMMGIELVKVSTSADARFRAAFAWLEHDAAERQACSNDILASLSLIPGKISREALKKACYSNALSEASTKKLLDLLACSLDVADFAVEPDYIPQASSPAAISSNCFSSPQNEISSVFCVGGHGKEDGKAFLKYNVTSKIWDVLDSLPWDRYMGGACVAGDRLLVFGGCVDEKESSIIAEYNISPEASSSPWDIQAFQLAHASRFWLACCVRNSTAYACGPKKQVLEYTPSTNTWKQKPCMLRERDGSSLAYSQMSDCVYVAGGLTSVLKDNQTGIDKFDVVNENWETIGRAANIRKHLGTAVHGDELYLIGGMGAPGSVEKFNIRTGKSCDSSVPRLLHGRAGCQAVLLYNNVVCVFGGGYESVEAYDVREGKWSTTGDVVPDMPIANSYFNLAWK